jgi:XTP/dITP diphosphohydrolase
MKLLIGTRNRAKQGEHVKILTKLAAKKGVELTLLFPQDLEIFDEPEETGQTIAENSLIKAKYYFEKSGIPTLGDDGGFEIDILGGLPGVQAKYWAGPEGDDDKIIAKTISKLQNYSAKEDRKARLRICITYFDGVQTIQEKASNEGYVSEKPTEKMVKGFPYRALFIVSGAEKYYDELSREEHEKYNHREIALTKLFDTIVSYDSSIRKTGD